MRAWQYSHFARKHADFVELSAIWAGLGFHNTAAHIFMQCHSKGFVVLVAHIGVFFTDLFSHLFVELPAEFVYHFVALWIGSLDFFTNLTFNPCINSCLNFFIR